MRCELGVVDLFKFQGCESLLSPEEVIYPELVREFYSNFQLLQEGLVFSNVRGTRVVFKADALVRIGANNLFVSKSNELHFDETHRPVGGLPKSPNYDKSKMYWHKKRDWIGDCTLEEITTPFPLPAIPPPSVFGMIREEYKEKIFEWLRERDGKAPAHDAFDKLFSEYGSAPVFPTAKDKASGSGKNKGKAPDLVHVPQPFGRLSEILDLDNGLGPHWPVFENAPNFGLGEVDNPLEPFDHGVAFREPQMSSMFSINKIVDHGDKKKAVMTEDFVAGSVSGNVNWNGWWNDGSNIMDSHLFVQTSIFGGQLQIGGSSNSIGYKMKLSL
ncbi:hypothetical protein AgCh_000870 [Apium graveolens]